MVYQKETFREDRLSSNFVPVRPEQLKMAVLGVANDLPQRNQLRAAEASSQSNIHRTLKSVTRDSITVYFHHGA